MSEKERQKKDGRDKNKKNQARREDQKQTPTGRDRKDKPAGYGEGEAGKDVAGDKR